MSSTRKKKSNKTAGQQQASRVEREQPRKDSGSKRVNYDNARVDKVEKSIEIKKTQKNCTPESTRKGDNDVTWYARNPELMKASASLPFASIVGFGIPWSGNNTKQYVPGIMSFNYVPALGGELDKQIAVNQAATSTYSYLVHANSRNYTYESSDLMMLILSGAQVFAILGHVIRAYGVAKSYTEANMYKPTGLLTAMGFDPVDFRQNLSRIWFDINELIARSKQIWIPNTFPVVNRWFWMNSNVYMDSDDPKAQIYLYVPDRFYKFSENYGPNSASGLVPVVSKSTTGDNTYYSEFTPGQQTYTWNEWMYAINSMFDALLKSEDRGIMFGDILNAYGADKIYALPEISSDWQIAPIPMNAEVLSQFENLVTSKAYPTSFYQDLNRIDNTWNPVASGGTAGPAIPASDVIPYQVLLNFHQPTQPTPEQIIVATRCTVAGTTNETVKLGSLNADTGVYVYNSTSVSNTPVLATCGTEIVTSINVYLASSTSVSLGQYTVRTYYSTAQAVQALKDFQAFDWHPFLYNMNAVTVGQIKSSAPYGYVKDVTGDFNNYTTVDYTVLSKMHNMAILSEFGVPQM